MAQIKIKNLCKTYPNGYSAIKDFTLDIEDKEFIIFVGPSGCGKSTTLRMIAGLEEISSGELWIDDKLINDVEPKDRDIAMVFQNYALYPHMNVYENMSFGLKLKNTKKQEIDSVVNKAAKILNLSSLLDRYPKELSGGQRQRVAMGRAIVRTPKVFLMDEPLSNLDAKLRAHMRVEIARLHKELGTTFIYVTHDQVEAMTLGTRIVVMKDGIIQQVDTPRNLYYHPKNMFVAGFIGTPQINFIPSQILEEEGKVYIKNEMIKKELLESDAKILRDKGYIGKEIVIGIRPENIKLSDTGKTFKINNYEMIGSESYIYTKLKNIELIVRVNSNIPLAVDDNVSFDIDENFIHFFDKESEISIKE